jgi:hypothetical protein
VRGDRGFRAICVPVSAGLDDPFLLSHVASPVDRGEDYSLFQAIDGNAMYPAGRAGIDTLKASQVSMMVNEGAGLRIESLPVDWREARLLGRFEFPQGPTPCSGPECFRLAGRDAVRVSSQKLGTLVNTVVTCNTAPPWTIGITALMRNLASRGLL